jgi:hypothetical protein
MHPKKAEFLAEIREDSRDNDSDLREELAVFVRPDRYGLATSLDAGLGAAMCISSAFMLDFIELAVSRIDDDTGITWLETGHYPSCHLTGSRS